MIHKRPSVVVDPSRPHDTDANAFDEFAGRRDEYRARNHAYHDEILRLVKLYVPPGSRVLEIGCSTGDLLAATCPSRGVGIDLSERTVDVARSKYPDLEFLVQDAVDLTVDGAFDWVLISDTIGWLSDIVGAFAKLKSVIGPDTRVLITNTNKLWHPAAKLASALGRRMSLPEENWLGRSQVEELLHATGFEPVTSGTTTLVPFSIPGVTTFANRWLAALPGLQHLCVIDYVIARPLAARDEPRPTATVVVPCRNEAGNIAGIFERLPDLGPMTELVFVDGNSTDETVEEIEARLPSRPNTLLIHQGRGTGKGDAVRRGFAAASGDVLFILDADLTVPPEDLRQFYDAIAEDRGEFINGSRLVYPMEREAMRFLNILGNKFFRSLLSYVLGRPLGDTLCGTKVLRRSAYERIAAERHYFGKLDPFGDFDLIFGAARLGLKFVEIPVRYAARRHGRTKIDRFRNGATLLRMSLRAFRKFRAMS